MLHREGARIPSAGVGEVTAAAAAAAATAVGVDCAGGIAAARRSYEYWCEGCAFASVVVLLLPPPPLPDGVRL